MPETVRHLFAVDAQGEVDHHCDSCLTKDQTIERLTRSYEGTIRAKNKEIAELTQEDPQADLTVIAIVDDWCDRALRSGWWSRKPSASKPRIEATQKALKTHAPAYLFMVHQGAFWRAQKRAGDPTFSRAWLEPMTIYGKFIDSHFETAMDPENEKVRKLIDTPARLLTRWEQVLTMSDECECGHWRLDHGKSWNGTWPCGVHGCWCPDFDDFHIQVEEWRRERQGRA